MPFGEVDAIELAKDPLTGQNKGHAIVEFRHHRDAKVAVKSMDGFEVSEGCKLKVNILTDSSEARGFREAEEDLGEDQAGTYLHSA